jgi:serpin B
VRLFSVLPLLAVLGIPGSAAALTPASPPAADAGPGNDFTFALYGKVKQGQDNVFVSGPSLREALGIAYLGARGSTAQEMSRAIHVDADADKSAAQAKVEIADFSRASGGATLAIANRLWADGSFTMKPAFVNAARDGYGSPVDPVDFRHHPEDARTTINAWVADRTNQNIKDLLPGGSVSSDTSVVITNAIWFKGSWQSAFTKESTHDAPFKVFGKDAQNVPTMHQTGTFGYAATDGVKVLEMGYERSDLAMDFILPDDAAGLARVEESLSTGRFRAWTSALESKRVAVSLPKVKFTWGGSVKQPLKDLGMRTAFDRRGADFSGIANAADVGGNLYVSDVFHKAFVAIDEKGTEAAAASAVIIAREAAAIPEPPAARFDADHPFLFAIRDTKSGRVLFFGRVTNPKA